MSTRASITLKTIKGTYKTVYLHYDGYLSYTGKILLNHYNTFDKVEQFIRLGDASYITESIECPDGHTFNTPVDGYSVFYKRDRGEEGVDAYECDTYEEVMERNRQECNYLFQDGKWYVNDEELTKEMVE